MAEYLMPHNEKISIEEKQWLFSVRNRMIDIGNNFGKNEECIICKQREDMNHIYNYKYQNKHSNKIPFGKIHTGNLNEQIKVFKILISLDLGLRLITKMGLDTTNTTHQVTNFHNLDFSDFSKLKMVQIIKKVELIPRVFISIDH